MRQLATAEGFPTEPLYEEPNIEDIAMAQVIRVGIEKVKEYMKLQLPYEQEEEEVPEEPKQIPVEVLKKRVIRTRREAALAFGGTGEITHGFMTRRKDFVPVPAIKPNKPITPISTLTSRPVTSKLIPFNSRLKSSKPRVPEEVAKLWLKSHSASEVEPKNIKRYSIESIPVYTPQKEISTNKDKLTEFLSYPASRILDPRIKNSSQQLHSRFIPKIIQAQKTAKRRVNLPPRRFLGSFAESMGVDANAQGTVAENVLRSMGLSTQAKLKPNKPRNDETRETDLDKFLTQIFKK